MTETHRARCELQRAPYMDFEYPLLRTKPAPGGNWEPSPGTFHVEEIPLYPFSGSGEHAVLVVRKEGQTTRDLAVAAAKHLGLPPSAVGYAGMKDKSCVAIQAFTVSGVTEDAAAEAFAGLGADVVSRTRHRNKLRLGHLAGNRFRVLIRDVDPKQVLQVLLDLSETGTPNYYGPQRFGARGDNAARGLAVLQGRLRVGRWQRDLLVSSLQSRVFNEVLARRIEAATLGAALPGDVLRREDSGGLFVCESPEEDGPRVQAFAVSPTGPMPGRKMIRPTGEVAEEEERVLAAMGLEERWFGKETGTRRALRFRIDGGAVEPTAQGCWASFSCPSGSYATAVVREITGPQQVSA